MPIDAEDQLWWICSRDMVSDQLTKSARWDAVEFGEYRAGSDHKL